MAGVERRLFKCRDCTFASAETRTFVDHQVIHKQNNNFRFRCPDLTCSRSFALSAQAYNHFRTHLLREHPTSTSAQSKSLDPPPQVFSSSTGPSVKCSLTECSELSFHSLDSLRKHLYGHIDSSIRVECPFKVHGKCTHEPGFIKKTTLSSHLSSYHKSAFENIVTAEASSSEKVDIEMPNTEVPEEQKGFDDFETLMEHEEAPSTGLFTSDQIEDFIAKLYLKWESKYHIPTSTVQSISEDLSILSEMCHHQLLNSMTSKLCSEGLSTDKAKDITSETLKNDTFYNVHHKGCGSDTSFASSYLRSVYFKNKYDFVEPEEILLGKNSFGIERFAHYVPIEKTLKVLLKDSTVASQVRSSFQNTTSSKPGLLCDYTDGDVFAKSAASKRKSLHLMLFLDACEIVNPLGAARSHYKLLCMYYTLGNIDVRFRSKVDNLQLAMVLYDKDFKEFSQDVCLGRLLSDLKSLEVEGVEFDGEMLPVYLMFVLGDNLGQNELGGFACGFTGNYWCRFCDMSKTEFKATPFETKPLRTPESYESDLTTLKELKAQNPAISRLKGLIHPCVLNELNFFKVCDPRLCPCLAHDVLLGVVSHDLWLFIRYFVSLGWFDLATLNKRVQNFKFAGSDARDKPAMVHAKLNKLKGSAVQNWNMMRFFSLLVGDLIENTSDPVWQLYLKLKKITDLVTAPEIHIEQVAFLDNLIKEYILDRSTLVELKNLKGSQLIPKHHFLCHYPSLIVQFGPLVRVWTLKFEAKHSWLRNAALSARNFIHITKTVASKHQLFFAYNCTGPLFSEEVQYNFSTPLDLTEYTPVEKAALASLPSFEEQTVVKVKNVHVYGTHYKQGLWIVIDHSPDNGLTVGLIHNIFCDKLNNIFLLCKSFNAHHNPNYGLYEVKNYDVECDNFVAVKLNDVGSFYPLSAYVFKTETCLTLKYSVPPKE